MDCLNFDLLVFSAKTMRSTQNQRAARGHLSLLVLKTLFSMRGMFLHVTFLPFQAPTPAKIARRDRDLRVDNWIESIVLGNHVLITLGF